MEKQQKLKELGAVSSFAIYISAAILLYLGTHFFIPYLSKATGQETILCWFIVAGLGVFTPFILIGIFILKKEGYSLSKSTFSERLRFRKLSKRDVVYSIVGLIIVGILSGLILKVMEMFIGNVNTTPSFMSFEPLSSGRYWLLLVWLPYWFLNILGEEFLWRGIMLPRQEIAFGKYT
ncbi:MAG TPA: CPBP family intramembrane metalloprotease, partial [Candidatus Kapabacteria bacterium]|nr:CPBP family intramembrane metalloprotease [Candidatus Kapabacteria bacterium]